MRYLAIDLYPFLNLKVPLSNGTDVTEYRLEWGGVEGSMQICYSGPNLSYELKGLLPATTYYCRVQVKAMRALSLTLFMVL